MMTSTVQSLQNVLLAFDGSEHAWAAVSLLRDLLPHAATLSPARVTIMGVLPPRNASEHATLQDALERAQRSFEEGGLRAEATLHVGQPAETLVEYADRYSPDLIAIGAKGRRAALSILMGGVAQQVLEYAQCPVLVIRSPYAGLRRVLLVTDGSPYSQRAVSYLARFPLPPSAELHVAHVLPPLYLPEMTMPSWPLGADIVAPLPTRESADLLAHRTEDEERQGEVLITRTFEEMMSIWQQIQSPRLTAAPPLRVLLRGDAAAEIIEYAKTQQVDLIVGGSRGLGTIKGWLLGSVSRKLAHYAPCSVMIVRGGSHEANR
jgi:nucleotide-binding universal stress UspA family protein